MKQKNYNRLEFLESYKEMDKNIDVMEKVFNELKMRIYMQIQKLKKKEKKLRKLQKLLMNLF